MAGYNYNSPATPLPSLLSILLALSFCMAVMLDQARGFRSSSPLSSVHRIAINNQIHTERWTDAQHSHGRVHYLALSSTSTSQENDSESTILSAKAKELLDKAEQLRQEIAALEDSKEQAKEEERQVLQAELNKQEAYLQHYSGVVPILKPDGSVVMERVQFPPLVENEEDSDDFASEILVCEASLPLGMILGQDNEANAMILVDEVLPDSNGALAGIQEGDVLRACTSCKVEMEQPTWQLLVGGIGRPKTMRFMLGTDDKPLEMVLEALGANRMDPEARPVVLVVERPKK